MSLKGSYLTPPFKSSSEENASDLCCVISSLVQVMMDSYCRTKLGFQSLIQKEWIMGGHAFVNRCNHLRQTDKDEVIGRTSACQ